MLVGANHAKSESLFAALDSTIDTTRVSNTIRKLNADPDRWLAVYRGIEKAMGPGGRESAHQKRTGEDPAHRVRSSTTTKIISPMRSTNPACVRMSRSRRLTRRRVIPS